MQTPICQVVTEPTADTTKFPTPQVYFYQARGFSLAECYYQSLNTPYEGLIVAEPLAAPFQRPATGNWIGISSNAVLSGAAQLSLQFSAVAPELPLQRAGRNDPVVRPAEVRGTAVDRAIIACLSNLMRRDSCRCSLVRQTQPFGRCRALSFRIMMHNG